MIFEVFQNYHWITECIDRVAKKEIFCYFEIMAVPKHKRPKSKQGKARMHIFKNFLKNNML